LIVDDEPGIRQMLSFTLAGDGYGCAEAGDIEEAQASLLSRRPDLILLDWMLPGISGIDFARRLKRDSRTADIPIIMLTAKTEESDKIKGLDSGADDYITKPIKPRVLLSKIKSLLRRADGLEEGISPNSIELHGLIIDKEQHLIFKGGEAIHLPKKQFEILLLLSSKPGKVFNRDVMMSQVWGDDIIVGDRNIDVQIRKLREKIGEDYIRTIKGVGYKFVNPEADPLI
jgi:two-component system alkaline phosphatase synthesis response regulator PhoP